ncbi:MAG: helix-turn-helix domain-containing protein [Ruminococcus sp.]|nr:helix-turn-helix domain-containing protein [Ruminococcus sp.]
MAGNSFDLYDYEQARKSFNIWQVQQAKDMDDYMIRQRKADLNRLVKKVIKNELSERDRLIITLSWYKGVPKEKIAEMLGMSRSSVFRRLEKINNIIYEKLKYAIEYRYGSGSLAASPVLIKSCVCSIDEKENQTIGERLRQLRRVQFLTTDDVSQSTGISERRISAFETNAQEITVTELKKLAAFFKVKTDYIIFGESRVLRDPLTGMPIKYNCKQ